MVPLDNDGLSDTFKEGFDEKDIYVMPCRRSGSAFLRLQEY